MKKESNKLFNKMFWNMFPGLLVSGMSGVLLTTIDGLVIGNVEGSNALSAVNMLYPLQLLISCFVTLITCGLMVRIPKLMATGDKKTVAMGYKASYILSLIGIIAISLIQIPIAFFVFRSLTGDPTIYISAWKYAAGILISTPFQVISTVEVYILVLNGKTKEIAGLSIFEGVLNLGFDILLVKVLQLGIAGAGYGTLLAIVCRVAVATVYIKKKTNAFKIEKGDCRNEIKEIFLSGGPGAVTTLLLAVQDFAIIWFISNALGAEGVSAKGIIYFFSIIATMIASGIINSSSSIYGLKHEIKDYTGAKSVVREMVKITAIVVGGMAVIVMIWPNLLFLLYGNTMPKEIYYLAARVFCIAVIFKCFNIIFGMLIVIIGKKKVALLFSILETVGLFLPAVFLIWKFLPGQYLWLSYLISSSFVFIMFVVYYLASVKKEKASLQNVDILKLTVIPSDASYAAQKSISFFDDLGYNHRDVYKLGVCIEEVCVNQGNLTGDSVNIEITAVAKDNECIVSFLDDNKKQRDIDNTTPEMMLGGLLVYSYSERVKYLRPVVFNYHLIKLKLRKI